MMVFRTPVVTFAPAKEPTTVLSADAATIAFPARAPTTVFRVPSPPASYPTYVFIFPVLRVLPDCPPSTVFLSPPRPVAALIPTTTLLLPVTLDPANAPIKVLLFPIFPDENPMYELKNPLCPKVANAPVCTPTIVLLDEFPISSPACCPMTQLNTPRIFAPAPAPTNVLFEPEALTPA